MKDDFRRSLVISVVGIAFLPILILSISYRISLKSTAILWLPLLWVIRQSRPGINIFDRLQIAIRDPLFKLVLGYSLAVIILFVTKIAWSYSIWREANLNWAGTVGVFAIRLAAPMELPLWQGTSFCNAVLAWIFYFWASRQVLGHGTSEERPRGRIAAEYASLQVVRTTLSLYTIACTFYIAIAVAHGTEWPPIRLILFPWTPAIG